MLTILTRYPHIDYLVDLALRLFQSNRIFVFPLAYALLVLWYSERRPVGSGDYVAAGAAVILVLFALTFFHPQYTVWLVPFLALMIDRRNELIGNHLVQIGLLGLYALNWGTGMTWDMLRPLGAPVLGSLPDPMTIIDAQRFPPISSSAWCTASSPRSRSGWPTAFCATSSEGRDIRSWRLAMGWDYNPRSQPLSQFC